MERGVPDKSESETEAKDVSSDRAINSWRRLFLRPEFFQGASTKKENAEEDDDDEEGEATTPSSRRMRRLLKRLGIFRAEPKEAPKDPVAILPVAESVATPLGEAATPLPDVQPVAAYAEQVPAIEHPAIIPDLHPVVAASIGHNERTNLVATEKEPIQEASVAEETPVFQETRMTAVADITREHSVAEAAAFTAPIAERFTRPLAAPETTIVPRDPLIPLVALGLGAEYIGRRRADKKIKTEFRREDKQLHTEINRTAYDNKRLERTVYDNQNRTDQAIEAVQRQAETVAHRQPEQSQPASIEKKQPAQEAPAPVKPSVEAVAMRPVEAVATNSIEISKPVQTLPTQEFGLTDTNRFAEANIQPAAVMEQVVAAAERNIPIERVYERRHEVKDDPGVSTTTASSVGSVLAGSAGLYGASNFSSVPPVANTSNQVRPSGSPSQDNATYKSAMIAGFGGALALITLGIIAFLF